MRAEQWDEFFVYQAGWGKSAREFVYRHTDLYRAENVLELGCGTGVITREIAERTEGKVVAVDINKEFLGIAGRRVKEKNVEFLEMDAHSLDFPDRTFDRIYFANFLLWARVPDKVFSEIARTLKPSGYLGILSEPDYGGRVDYPCEGIWERVVLKLKEEGANPFIGRRLRELCRNHGFEVKLDALQGMFAPEEIQRCYEFEAEFAGIPEKELEIARKAVNQRIAFLIMPVIYGYGWRRED
ncbi:MAG: class I SAM-dependent methyltransferase [Thermoplasmata archaeon]|nr:class I SAM-dependent methyltransferase [Thermoplasmata archaeon]